MSKRFNKILNVISCRHKISVSELSELMHVSEVTIRKDLSELERENLIRREHGFATVVETDDIGRRLAFNHELKRAIAQKALEKVSDGETIMIESGSCCALLAEEVISKRRDVTIITNSVFIASFVRNKVGSRIILLGGEFQNESQVVVGPLIKKCVEDFFVDKFFFGTDGFNDVGAMSGDLMRAEAVKNMAASAGQKIILTESRKFSQPGVVNLMPYKSISAIYTDNEVAECIRAKLGEKLVFC